MTIEEMLAREAIRKTMARYNSNGDRGQISEMVKAFTEDAVLDTITVGQHKGRAAIEAFMNSRSELGRKSAPTQGRARHFLSTSQIEFQSESEALGWTYFQLLRSGQILEIGIYIDRFRKVGAEWLIAERRVKIEWNGHTD